MLYVIARTSVYLFTLTFFSILGGWKFYEPNSRSLRAWLYCTTLNHKYVTVKYPCSKVKERVSNYSMHSVILKFSYKTSLTPSLRILIQYMMEAWLCIVWEYMRYTYNNKSCRFGSLPFFRTKTKNQDPDLRNLFMKRISIRELLSQIRVHAVKKGPDPAYS